MSKVRTAAFLATQKARADSKLTRTGKTRKKAKCNPPNRLCGARCIPQNWDCRLKGEGGDGHLKALGSGSDPLGAIAGVQRGGVRIIKGLTKGNPSEVEGGRRAIIRGAVKALPGDLQQKKETQARLIKATVSIGTAAAFLTLGIRGHGLLMKTRRYRDGIGGQIEDAVGGAFRKMLDHTPLIGPGRRMTRLRAQKAVNATGRRLNRINTQVPGIGDTTWRPTDADLPYEEIASRLTSVRPDSFHRKNTTFYDGLDSWQEKSMGKLWTMPRTAQQRAVADIGEGAYFSTVASENFLRRQYGFDDNVNGKTLVRNIQRRLKSDHDSLSAYAADLGFDMNAPRDRSRFVDRLMQDQDIPTAGVSTVRSRLQSMVSPDFDAEKSAFDVYRKTATKFDHFFQATATQLESLYDAKGNRRRSIPYERAAILQTAEQVHAKVLAERLYPGRPNPVRGPATSELVTRHFYVSNGQPRRGVATWSPRSPGLVIRAAREMDPKVKTLDEALNVLRSSGAFGDIN